MVSVIGSSTPFSEKYHDAHTQDTADILHVDTSSYTLGTPIALGRFSAVLNASSPSLAKPLAVKITTLPPEHSSLTRHLTREITHHRSLSTHPHIVKLHASTWNPDTSTSVLVMENPKGGDLLSHLESLPGKRMSDTKKIATLFKQLIDALEHAHSKGILHRDLKPENILLNPEADTLYLADFGYSTSFSEEKRPSTPCGDPRYAAPEVTLSNEGYDEKADIFSLGVLLWRMATPSLPFGDYNGKPTDMREIRDNVHADRKRAFPPFFEEPLKDLLTDMLNPTPSKRPSLEDIKKHPFLT